VNNGEYYPSRFDQTHNLNLTGFYDLSERATLSATFVYNTGTPVTLASSGYYVQGYYIPHNEGGGRKAGATTSAFRITTGSTSP